MDALRDALSRAEAQGGTVVALATIARRLPEVGALGLPVRVVEIAGIVTLTRSPRILTRHGTGSVAEAAALSACGPGARLTVTRVTSTCGRATAAIAEIGELQ